MSEDNNNQENITVESETNNNDDSTASIEETKVEETTVKETKVEETTEKTTEKTTIENTNTETFAFQAEINQLLSLIINTFYSNKDIFLRELISNSSDALDKIRYKSIQDKTLLSNDDKFYINIEADKQNKKLIITDSGIGMTKSDLVNNLGTIAQSGTKNFAEALKDSKDISMIGQFGVGFYASYLVANKVVVTSKNMDDEQYIWESSASGTFTITKDEYGEKLNRGTKIELYLKDDQQKYLEVSTIQNLIKQHNQFINYPISVLVENKYEEEVEVEDEETKIETISDKEITIDNTTSDEPIIEDVNDEEKDVTEKPKKTKKVERVENVWEVCNKQKPIWTKNPNDVEKDEYNAFYKTISNDWEEPLIYKHFSVEGQMEFKSIIYVPSKAPFDLFQKNKKSNNIKLYVRRVFISDDSESLCPEWLSFIKGVVDSEDLPLNISREILQQNKIVKVIKKNIIKKAIEAITELSNDVEKYNKFYENFSKNIKLGIHEDEVNRNKIANLLRFKSYNNKDKMISLETYIDNMKDNQQNIYFITGESIKQIENAPFLEKLTSNGYDVLYMTDAIDEYMIQSLKEFDGKKMVNITKNNTKFDDLDISENKEDETKYNDFCKAVQTILSDNIEKVVVSKRLVTSPCCLVTQEYGWSANMERIIKAQALSNNNMRANMNSKKILEINTQHDVIKELLNKYNKTNVDVNFKNLVYLIYDTSLLASGFNIEKPDVYANRMYNLIKLGLCPDDEEVVDKTTEEKQEINIDLTQSQMETVD